MQADTGFKDPIGGSDTAVRIVIEADMMAVRHGLQDL